MWMVSGQMQLVMSALALESERVYGRVRGGLDLADIVNNPMASRAFCIYSLSSGEQLPNAVIGQFGVLADDRLDARLIGLQCV